jgi:hypothetical protein
MISSTAYDFKKKTSVYFFSLYMIWITRVKMMGCRVLSHVFRHPYYLIYTHTHLLIFFFIITLQVWRSPVAFSSALRACTSSSNWLLALSVLNEYAQSPAGRNEAQRKHRWLNGEAEKAIGGTRGSGAFGSGGGGGRSGGASGGGGGRARGKSAHGDAKVFWGGTAAARWSGENSSDAYGGSGNDDSDHYEESGNDGNDYFKEHSHDKSHDALQVCSQQQAFLFSFFVTLKSSSFEMPQKCICSFFLPLIN